MDEIHVRNERALISQEDERINKKYLSPIHHLEIVDILHVSFIVEA